MRKYEIMSQCKDLKIGLIFSTIKYNYFFLYGFYEGKYDTDMFLTDFAS